MKQANEPLVYLLVLNYCALDDTLQCIEAIRHLSYRNTRLLVIDNCSPDGSGDVLRDRIPAEELLQLSSNLGYAGGNNVGIRIALAAGAEYVLILNPDVRVPPESVTGYLELMEADRAVGALNPIQLSPDGTSIDKRFRWQIWGTSKLPDQLRLEPGQQWSATTLLGAALFLSATALRRVGLFDPLYFAYGEEQDLCRRLRYHNYRLVVTSTAPVRHLRTHESRGTDDLRLFLRLKGVYLFELKDPNRPFYVSLAVAVRLLFRDLISGTSRYAHSFTARHYRLVVWWVARHLWQIREHITIEKRGKAYL